MYSIYDLRPARWRFHPTVFVRLFVSRILRKKTRKRFSGHWAEKEPVQYGVEPERWVEFVVPSSGTPQ